MARCAFVAVVAALVGATAGCGGTDEDEKSSTPKTSDPGPIHIHGLGVNPADGALLIATHTGLFRAPAGERKATRIANRYQDTMGFTVVGPDRFLGSGHPDGRDGLPPFLGLIESRDAGRSWKPVSLLGERDFHALEAAGPTVYGYGSDFDSRTAAFLASEDSGRTWEERPAPEPIMSFAVDPNATNEVVASSEDGLYRSPDGGRTWRPIGGSGGLVVRASDGRMIAVDLAGAVTRLQDDAWEPIGEVGGPPAALDNGRPGELLVALHDGTVKRSHDGGATWQVRSAP